MRSASSRAPVLWARSALLALLGSVAVPLVVAGLKSVLWVLVGVAGLVLTAVGVWWALAHTGVVRAVGTLVSVAAPLAVLALYAVHDLLWPACVSLGLWVLAVVAARIALTPAGADSGRRRARGPVQPPRRPWILMNPNSGGGKVARFHLAERARAAGAGVVLLDPARHQDVAELARRAVAEGADLLGVAGGDGTQALVAEVAARHGLPFIVIPAGTRNHFALDLGLDRDDPAAALEALTDGDEFRVDLGFAADRVFVNNVSFGTYAAVVADPAYRDQKVRTTLRELPDLLTGDRAPSLRMRAGRTRAEGLQALLVSNNPYRRALDVDRPGRRVCLDSGRLGVLCVHVGGTAQAAQLVRGPGAPGLRRLTAREVVVETDAATVPAGIDGEHVMLPVPVVCRIVPGTLRVRVPRHRPGSPVARPAADWPRVARLALGR
ncbi:diacylglycerol/lipid kinase family protein [Streptomyces diastatochromogenes]|uniref:Diacylglycerol kinase n=1 Tax=Streptomyces diastatochromogenes TaxID=42236 RepID=A0A233S2N3_STRDA|nr:diacylglycerol kinase family protein [Streptomyces diastatochromogenes]OXY89853.1 diacylglycerol kinase [Streptomyces diastatochromogenes]